MLERLPVCVLATGTLRVGSTQQFETRSQSRRVISVIAVNHGGTSASPGSVFASSHAVTHFHTIILSVLVLAIYFFRIFSYYNEFLTLLFSLLLPNSYRSVKVSLFQRTVHLSLGGGGLVHGSSLHMALKDESLPFRFLIREPT